MIRVAALLVAVLALQAPPVQQVPPVQPQVFRAGRTTVAVPVTVVDAYGNIRTNLHPEDFRLFDDGREQDITNFSSGEAPITSMILLDTSASMTAGLALAKHAAEQFIIRMRPGDRAQVGSFNGQLTTSGRFTDDRDALLRAVQQDLPFGNPTRLFDALDNALSVLAPERGRRVVLLLTDGCDTTSTTNLDGILSRVRTEDVVVYGVQIYSPVRRPRMPGAAGDARRRVPDCPELEAQFMPADARGSLVGSSDPRRLLTPDQILHRVTIETGGGRFSLRPQDNVNSTFTALMNELHHQYLLGFAPPQKDGDFHQIRVAVSEPRLLVRSRRSYRADPPDGGRE